MAYRDIVDKLIEELTNILIIEGGMTVDEAMRVARRVRPDIERVARESYEKALEQVREIAEQIITGRKEAKREEQICNELVSTIIEQVRRELTEAEVEKIPDERSLKIRITKNYREDIMALVREVMEGRLTLEEAKERVKRIATELVAKIEEEQRKKRIERVRRPTVTPEEIFYPQMITWIYYTSGALAGPPYPERIICPSCGATIRVQKIIEDSTVLYRYACTRCGYVREIRVPKWLA